MTEIPNGTNFCITILDELITKLKSSISKTDAVLFTPNLPNKTIQMTNKYKSRFESQLKLSEDEKADMQNELKPKTKEELIAAIVKLRKKYKQMIKNKIK